MAPMPPAKRFATRLRWRPQAVVAPRKRRWRRSPPGSNVSGRSQAGWRSAGATRNGIFARRRFKKGGFGIPTSAYSCGFRMKRASATRAGCAPAVVAQGRARANRLPVGLHLLRRAPGTGDDVTLVAERQRQGHPDTSPMDQCARRRRLATSGPDRPLALLPPYSPELNPVRGLAPSLRVLDDTAIIDAWRAIVEPSRDPWIMKDDFKAHA